MANLRIIYDNAADRVDTLDADSTAGTLAIENALTDSKTEVYRSVGTSATITLTWTDTETVGGVILPFCNLTPLGTIRARGYTTVGGVVALFDTGAVMACPAPVLGLWGWGATPLGSNAFPYGGGTYARVWPTVPGAVKKLVIDIEDDTNEDGYIEFARIVTGAYWSPQTNADYDARVSIMDTTVLTRNASGGLIKQVGTRHRMQSLNLNLMPPTDRAELWRIMAGNGKSGPILFSLYPNDADTALEQAHQMYCTLVNDPTIGTPFFSRYSGALELGEV